MGLHSAQVWPAETSMRSAPSSQKARAISTASSGVTPRSPIQSLAEMRTDIGLSAGQAARMARNTSSRSEEHTSELQSLMRNSFAVFCLKKKRTAYDTYTQTTEPAQD